MWQALSDPFLDTDIALFPEGNTRQLTTSACSLEELEAILREEVQPACSFNPWQVAGEWAGFDASWLERRVLRGGPGGGRWPRYLSSRLVSGPVRLLTEWVDWQAEVARRRERPGRSTPSAA